MRVLCLSFAIALLDQWTKELARTRLAGSEPVDMIPGFFALRYAQNTGAAWSMFEGLNVVLVAVSVVMLVLVVVFRRQLFPESPWSRVTLGLIMGGIAGNLMDRLRWDYVVDFLDFYLGTQHFPTFNVADSAICTGVGLYILHQFIGNRSGDECRNRATSA